MKGKRSQNLCSWRKSLQASHPVKKKKKKRRACVGFSSSQKKEKRKSLLQASHPLKSACSAGLSLQSKPDGAKKSIFLLALRVNNKLDFVLYSKNSRNLIVMLCIQSVSLGAVKEKVLSINNQTHACNSPLQHLKI